MDTRYDLLHADPLASASDLVLPRQRRQSYFASPVDWRDEVLYFLLPDRFSDGQEQAADLLDRGNLSAARPPGFRFDRWAESGGSRWQGGTLKGVQSKVGYLQQLGITAVWIAPIFKQRVHLDTYHGYGIQHFLEVDPRFGRPWPLRDPGAGQLPGIGHLRLSAPEAVSG